MAGAKGGRLSAIAEVGELTSVRQSISVVNWGLLRSAYNQAKGNLDFSHIEADVQFSSKIKAQGGHFSASENWAIQEGTESMIQVYPNGVVRARIDLLGSDGNYYAKTNNKGWSTLTPFDWSLTRAKGEMSNAWVNRTQTDEGWVGVSSGVEFRFSPPNKSVNQWRGYPVKPENN